MAPKRKHQSATGSRSASNSEPDISPKPAKNPAYKNDYLPPEQAKAMTEWQEKMTTVAERDWHMFLHEMYTDCEFSIGEGEKPTLVKSHRSYLAKTSPYFSSMFYGDMKRNSEEVIHLPGVYVYLGELDLYGYSYEVVCGLLHLAKMYLLPIKFRHQIRHHLWQNIYPFNVWTAIEFGKTNDEPKIERTAWQIIIRKTNILLNLPSFLDIPRYILISLVKRNTLRCTEIELFEACQLWAKKEASRLCLDPTPSYVREILEDVLPHIRFLAMDKDKFATNVVESKLFTTDETHPILVYHLNGKLNKDISPIFNTNTNERVLQPREYFDVLGNPKLEGVKYINEGDNSNYHSTSRVFAIGNKTFKDSDVFLGVQIPSQIKDVSSNDDSTSYKENLTLFVVDQNKEKIISKTHFKSVVNYNSIIDVPLNEPLDCGAHTNPLKDITCFIMFHQSGKYPSKRYTIEKSICEKNKVFTNIRGVNLYYNYKMNFFHSFACV